MYEKLFFFFLFERSALDISPGGFVFPVTEHCLHFIDRIELAIAEIVQNGVKEQLHDLADARIFPERFFLHQQRADGEDNSVEYATRKKLSMKCRFTTPNIKETGTEI